MVLNAVLDKIEGELTSREITQEKMLNASRAAAEEMLVVGIKQRAYTGLSEKNAEMLKERRILVLQYGIYRELRDRTPNQRL